MADEAGPWLSGWEKKYRIKQRIESLLPIAEGMVAPTRPDIDEPRAEADRRKERARVVTTRMLWAIYRDQIRDGDVNERLRRFFTEQAERWIWCEPDPIEGLRQFLGLPKRGKTPKRGAPRRNAMRDSELAADIHELRESGKTVREACTILCEQLQDAGEELDEQYLRKIYFRETKHPVDKAAVAAEVEGRKIARAEAERTQTNDRDDEPWHCDRPSEQLPELP
jgi:hypothetical protein